CRGLVVATNAHPDVASLTGALALGLAASPHHHERALAAPRAQRINLANLLQRRGQSLPPRVDSETVIQQQLLHLGSRVKSGFSVKHALSLALHIDLPKRALTVNETDHQASAGSQHPSDFK